MVQGPGDVFAIEVAYQNALSTTVTVVKASQGFFFGFYAKNTAASTAYLQVFDLAAADVILGTTKPQLSFGFNSSEAYGIVLPIPLTFATAISMAGTTDAENSSAGNLDVQLFFA